VPDFAPATWADRIALLLRDRAALERLSARQFDRARLLFEPARIRAHWEDVLVSMGVRLPVVEQAPPPRLLVASGA
jgi:hypothetical protein